MGPFRHNFIKVGLMKSLSPYDMVNIPKTAFIKLKNMVSDGIEVNFSNLIL
jgi:hypothetical protein